MCHFRNEVTHTFHPCWYPAFFILSSLQLSPPSHIHPCCCVHQVLAMGWDLNQDSQVQADELWKLLDQMLQIDPLGEAVRGSGWAGGEGAGTRESVRCGRGWKDQHSIWTHDLSVSTQYQQVSKSRS